jgi:glycosyltransferase involved in cell wall biosynthesis
MGVATGRPTVLLSMAVFWPGAAANGPVQACLNLVDALAPDYDFRIIARDRPFDQQAPRPDIEADVWIDRGNFSILYVRPESFTPRYFLRLFNATPHDLVHLNSFFDRQFTIPILVARRFAHLSRRPLLLSPRGEFAPGALQLKRLRKLLYLAGARISGLLDGIHLQATTTKELKDIRVALPGFGNIVIASDIPTRTETENCTPRARIKRKGRVKVVFVGRIHPMKNLDFALSVLSEVSCPVEYEIIGPVEDETHWHRCQELIRTMPAHITVRARGAASQTEVRAMLREADALFLPTRGENFGYAIVEALSEGTPVLISERTPWNEVTNAGAGWALPLEEKGAFVRAIEDLANKDGAARTAMSAAARRFAEAHFGYESAVAATHAVYASLLAAGQPGQGADDAWLAGFTTTA